jgi:hypothetical protein
MISLVQYENNDQSKLFQFYYEKQKKRLLQVNNMILEQTNLIKEVGELAIDIQDISEKMKKN